MTDIEVLRDPAKAAALLQPERLRVLEELLEPDSASGVARRLELPRQQVNYHLRQLESSGLVKFVEERRKGNCIERLVRATARSYLVSPEALGRLGEDPAVERDRFSVAYLLMAAARVIRDLAHLKSRAEKAGKRLATLTLETEVRFASAADRHAFAEELAGAVARLAVKYNTDRPGGRPFRFLLGAYPAITKPEQKGSLQ